MALEQLTSDLSRISNWGREKKASFSMPQKLNSSIFLLDTIFHTTMTSSSKTLRLKPSSVLNILGVSFSRDLSWKDHIISLSKQASKRLGVLRRLRSFFTPPQLLALYRGVVRPCMEYASHIW